MFGGDFQISLSLEKERSAGATVSDHQNQVHS